MKAYLDIARAALKASEKATAAALELLGALEAEKPAAAIVELPQYLSRKQAKAKLDLETRAFDRAGSELGFRKPGREKLLPTAELIAWIERQRAETAKVKTQPEPNDDAPIPFDKFRRALAGGRLAR